MKLKDVIQNYLSKNKLNNEQFAQLIGVSSRAVRWYLSGLDTPKAFVLSKICDVTGVKQAEIEV